MADPNISGGSGKAAQGYGWINSVWHKNPLLLGFSGQIQGEASDADTAAGTVSVDGVVVPAGEIWRITYVSMLTISGSCTNLWITHVTAGIGMIVLQKVPPTNSLWYPSVADLVMVEDDKLRVTGLTMTLADTLYLQWLGTRIDIDQ